MRGDMIQIYSGCFRLTKGSVHTLAPTEGAFDFSALSRTQARRVLSETRAMRPSSVPDRHCHGVWTSAFAQHLHTSIPAYTLPVNHKSQVVMNGQQAKRAQSLLAMRNLFSGCTSQLVCCSETLRRRH